MERLYRLGEGISQHGPGKSVKIGKNFLQLTGAS